MWIDVPEGRLYPLKHGYYTPRQPDDDTRRRGVSRDEVRRMEDEFFWQDPWASSTARSRFGTRNLVTSVSDLLSTIIQDSYVVCSQKPIMLTHLRF